MTTNSYFADSLTPGAVVALTGDTVLSNGSTLADVFASVKGDLEASRARVARATKSGCRKGETMRAMRENEARHLGKLQGYVNLLTLLGVDYTTL